MNEKKRRSRLIQRLLARAKSLLTSTQKNPADWFRHAVNVRANDTGIRINSQNALEYAPIHNAVTRISGHLGIMPLLIKRRVGEEIQTIEGPQQRLLRDQPNGFMAAQDFKEVVSQHAVLSGNGRAAIGRNVLGEPVDLMPISPDNTWTSLELSGGNLVEKWHHVTTDDGQTVRVPDADMLHVKGLSPDGLIGWALYDLARHCIGGGMAAERHQNRIFRHEAIPGLILQAPEGKMTSHEDRVEFLKRFDEWHVNRQGRTGLLPDGMKAEIIEQTGRDGQFLEHRAFHREEAALFTLVENMLGIESSVSYNSLQQRNQAYLTNCLSRWITKWEQEATIKLLTRRQRDLGFFYQYETRSLLQGSLAERITSYKDARAIGLYSQEEIRRFEGLGPPSPEENFDNPNTTATPPGGEAEQPDDDDEGAEETNGNGRFASAN